jgi:hypothetical protein
MQTSTRREEIARLVSYYHGADAGAEKADALRQAPREVVAADAATLSLHLGAADLERVADLLAAMSQEATKCSLADRDRTRRRIENALSRMKHAYWLRRALYGALYLLGLAFILTALYYSVRAKWGHALIIGGVGAAHIAISIVRNAISGVRESSSDLAQLRAAYGSFFAEVDQWQHRYTALDSADALGAKRVVAREYRRSAEHATELIERHCKPHPLPRPDLPSAPEQKA